MTKRRNIKLMTNIKNSATNKHSARKYHEDRINQTIAKHQLERRTQTIIQTIKKYSNPRMINSILDIGAADGLMLSSIKREFPWTSCIGIERSKELIEYCKDPKIKIIQGNTYLLPFKDRLFDVAIATAIIEHLEEPTKMLNESRRVLKKGGLLILTTPDPFFNKIAEIIGYFGKSSHERTYNLKELEKILTESNFLVLEAKKFMLSPCEFPFELKIEKIVKFLKINCILLNQLIIGKKCE